MSGTIQVLISQLSHETLTVTRAVDSNRAHSSRRRPRRLRQAVERRQAIAMVLHIWLVLSYVGLVLAVWPFPPKRFKANALVDAGSLGLGGRVIAFGDFNGDQL